MSPRSAPAKGIFGSDMETQKGLRLHIGIFGATNSGKSTLMNLLTGQKTSMVSDLPGTTTDPVYKNMEIDGLGPVTLIDTAGFSDATALGNERMRRTVKVLDEIDAAIVLGEGAPEIRAALLEKKIPVLALSWPFEARDTILQRIRNLFKEKERAPRLLEGIASPGDHLLLIMPQDESAPRGRLILPQVQTLREILDTQLTATVATPETMEAAIERMADPPDWIVTDSQVFAEVFAKKPEGTKITSFSILFARAKGDIERMVVGARTLDSFTESSRILISEACTHAPKEEDIGRVKIPRLLRKKIGERLCIDFSRGIDFPEDVASYDLIVMCGSCMFQRPVVQARIEAAVRAGVPVTNYGILIAALRGILDDVDWR